MWLVATAISIDGAPLSHQKTQPFVGSIIGKTVSSPVRVVAIVHSYNNEGCITHVVGALIAQGVQVYLLDEGSSDATVAAVETFRGRGVLGIEVVSDGGLIDRSPDHGTSDLILKRKEELARNLDADWFVDHEGTEFRESPWGGETLREAIQRVDALGYNAVDFQALSFPSDASDAVEEGDIRNRRLSYEPSQGSDRRQIRCWKRTAQPVVLSGISDAGAQFADRNIFPIRFLLRRYPSRNQAHPSLIHYDAEAVRFNLFRHHRDVERLERIMAANQDEADRLTDEREALLRDLQGLRSQLAEREATIAQLMASKSWKLTAPLRAIDERLRRR